MLCLYTSLGYLSLLDGVYDHEGLVGAVGFHMDGHPPAGVLGLSLGGQLLRTG